EVPGLDAGWFEACVFGPAPDWPPADRRDLREVEASALAGFDAVIHLAALSNDPLGNLDRELTLDINHRASVRLARAAREAGVERFLFASSCSLYGVQGDGLLDESATFHPITAYGESKVLVERDLGAMADDRFSPVFLRNATAYGVSPRLRMDIVVNNLVGWALTTGDVLIQSDGTPWRPLVPVEDFCRAFLAVLEAPRERVHARAFNVGRTSENYRVQDLADMVQAAVPGSRVRYVEGGGPDPRSYRVSCAKLEETLPEYRPEWTVERGVRELVDAFAHEGLGPADFPGERYVRLERIRALRDAGLIDDGLRWLAGAREAAR
ncbi:MAG TPA: SDR family oxidoreductase, partial [Longimicrobiales bacterium]|nr:SDR family oxidoreductase [Longimicrobiales bacterium]